MWTVLFMNKYFSVQNQDKEETSCYWRIQTLKRPILSKEKVFKLAPTYLVVTPVLLLTLLSAVPHHEASLTIRKHEMVFIIILKFEIF